MPLCCATPYFSVSKSFSLTDSSPLFIYMQMWTNTDNFPLKMVVNYLCCLSNKTVRNSILSRLNNKYINKCIDLTFPNRISDIVSVIMGQYFILCLLYKWFWDCFPPIKIITQKTINQNNMFPYVPISFILIHLQNPETAMIVFIVFFLLSSSFLFVFCHFILALVGAVCRNTMHLLLVST